MADNFTANPGTGGAVFAADDVGPGVLYPRVKISFGIDGAAVDVSASNAFPVTGPLTDAQLRAAAVPVSLASTTITGSVAVTGPLTDTQLRATPVPVSGTVAVNVISGFATEATLAARIPVNGQALMAASVPVTLASNQSALPVTGTFWQTTQPVSLASTTITGSVAVTGTFWQATQPVSFTQQALPANQSVNVAQMGGVATSMNTGVRDAGTQRVTIATNDLVPVTPPGSTLAVTATAAVNTAATATLPAAGAGLFHYITSIQVMKKYSVVGVAAGAGIIVTSTNLPGSPAWDTEQLASPAGTVARVVDLAPATPLRSAVANTATTIVCPLQLQTIWRINVTYYVGP